ncbi:hypothetical protein [Nonomuraea indica]|uniref:Uncharacterized protein n=1 Tax=Nonomuraea indica TaxID=1581193 RepID=A0ABW8A2Q4_9ACTN
MPSLVPGLAGRLSPAHLLMVLMASGTGTLVALRIYAGVTAPEIPPGELRKAASAFRRLADALDGGETGSPGPRGGAAGKADAAAASVWKHSSGQAVDEFAQLYLLRIMPLPAALARDCRVVAAGCDAYATLVDDVNRRFAELEKAIVQLLWLVAFQPLTTGLFGVAQAMAAVQLARLVRIAQALKSAFAANAARVMQMAFPRYLLTTLNYAAVDGAAYAAGSIALDRSVDLAYGLPLGSPRDNAEEFGKTVVANTGYILGYDVAKLGLRGPASRGGELAARLFGSGFGYTPVKGALDGDEEIMTTPEEWAGKLEGHGLRALIFPPGWRFGR